MSSPSATPTAAVEEAAAPMEAAEVPPTRDEQIARFEGLLTDGRKAHLLKDWTAASEKLSEAAELSVKVYGDFAPETYVPHYLYGSTQLELASIEKEVVDVQLAEDGEETRVPPTTSPNAEADHAQLAFESLDYARLVVEKQPEKTAEWLKREWEVRVLLAQCAMNENKYETAIEEHSKALEIVRSHFPEERREIAFLNVEMNRANRASKKFDEAAANLDAAIVALREFKDLKQKELEAAAEEAKPELKKLTEELDEMIVDLEDEKQMNASAKKDAQETEEVGQQQQDKENTAVSNEVVIAESKLADAHIEVVTYKRKAKDNDGHEDAEKKPKVDAEAEQATA
ncbi:hypothetical protein M3Y99_00198500 [Aphelenchoides fujianensis]|nr:hypothetical protein M3Y99_00198500 [Aphelenchoides fujianensis]